MGTPQLSDELVREAVEAVKTHGTVLAAAEALRLSRGTLEHRLRAARIRGIEPGAIVQPAPQGHRVRGVSTLYDAKTGEAISQWVRTAQDGSLSIEEAVAIAKGAFEDLPASTPIPPPIAANSDLLTLLALPDLHLGLYAWKGDSGGNWDLQIALDTYRKVMGQVAASAPASDLAVILGGGDYLHANTDEYRTQSGNVLDGDGRTDKVIQAAIQLAVFQVDLALQKHRAVVARFLKGNHDSYVSIAVSHALAAWYRNEPRVTVDTSADLYWWFRFGKVLLGAAHGHTVKITEMPLIMANRCPEDWGATTFRYVHMFHVHHKTQHVFEGGGVIAESHQSPVQQDAYHHGRGYLSGRSMQSITYHRELGEIVRNQVAVT